VHTVRGFVAGEELKADDVFTDLDASTGQVLVNSSGAAGGIELLFGGWKRSGYGREKGFEGLLGCTRTKTVVVGP